MRDRLEGARPSTLLLILLVTIPLLVAGLVVPSLALSVAVVVLGTFLGRAANRRARQEDNERRGRKKRG